MNLPDQSVFVTSICCRYFRCCHEILHLHLLLHNQLLNFNQIYVKVPGKGPKITPKFITYNGCKQRLQNNSENINR